MLIKAPNRWNSIGRKLGFTADQVEDITSGILQNEEKVRALFQKKANDIGLEKAGAQLLAACATIDAPTWEEVMDDLTSES